MPSALVGAASCAACATSLPAGAADCPVCGTRVVAAAQGSAVSGGAGALTGVIRATRGRRRIAAGVDLALVAAGAVVGGSIADAASRERIAPVTEAAVAAAVLVLAALALALAATGRTPGRRVMRLRTVDNLTGLPSRSPRALLAAVAGVPERTVVTGDAAAGRDPLARALRPRPLPLPREPEPGTVRLRRPPPEIAMARELLASPGEGVVGRLRSDSGDELVVAGPVLVGRQPEATAAVPAVHAVPDLSRTVARTHALLDWSEGLLWITDLGGASGTEVIARDGTRQPLVPGVRTAAAAGWQVRMGSRAFEVRTAQRVRTGRSEG